MNFTPRPLLAAAAAPLLALCAAVALLCGVGCAMALRAPDGGRVTALCVPGTSQI